MIIFINILFLKKIFYFEDTILEHYLQSWRDSLQSEIQKSGNCAQTTGHIDASSGVSWDRTNPNDDMPTDRAGFLRMVNRNHLLNSSNYSLSSLFSVGSVGGSVASLQSSTRYSFEL